MTALQRSPRKLNRLLAFGLSLIFVAYLAHAVFAQDTVPTEEPVLLMDATPTEIAPIEIIPTEIAVTGVLPTVLEVTPQPDNPSQPSPTPDEVQVEASPTVIEVTLEPTLTFILEPTIMPSPTIPALSLANVVIVSNARRLSLGSTLSLTIAAQGLSNVDQITLDCQADSTLLWGTTAAPGEVIPIDQSILTDSGFQANGLWTLTSDQTSLPLNVAEAWALWHLDYQVIGSGLATVTCTVQLTDPDGYTIPLTAPEIALTIETYAEVALLPTASADVITEPIPTTDSVEIVLTPIPLTETEEPIPTADPPLDESVLILQPSEDITVVELTAPDGISYISGIVETPLPAAQSTVTLTGTGVSQTLLVQADGTFSVYVPPGIYQITISAPYHLPYAREIQVSEQPFALPTIALQTMDVDGNGIVGIEDANVIIQNFGLAVSSAPASADLNGDGLVDIYDLAIVGANIPASR